MKITSQVRNNGNDKCGIPEITQPQCRNYSHCCCCCCSSAFCPRGLCSVHAGPFTYVDSLSCSCSSHVQGGGDHPPTCSKNSPAGLTKRVEWSRVLLRRIQPPTTQHTDYGDKYVIEELPKNGRIEVPPMPMANVGLLVAVLCNVNGTWCVLSFSVSVSAATPVHHHHQPAVENEDMPSFSTWRHDHSNDYDDDDDDSGGGGW